MKAKKEKKWLFPFSLLFFSTGKLIFNGPFIFLFVDKDWKWYEHFILFHLVLLGIPSRELIRSLSSLSRGRSRHGRWAKNHHEKCFHWRQRLNLIFRFPSIFRSLHRFISNEATVIKGNKNPITTQQWRWMKKQQEYLEEKNALTLFYVTPRRRCSSSSDMANIQKHSLRSLINCCAFEFPLICERSAVIF